MASERNRLSINIIAQITTFSVQLLVNFFLTPYIVKKIGADAYGFIGLTETFVLYAQVLTIALNSMAGRFVTIAYHQNDIDQAKKLFSSVFFANVILSTAILIVCALCVWHLEYIIEIPNHLVFDVKALFSFVFLNFIISVIFSTFQTATFIKNRLELNALRNIIANLLRVIVLFIAFGCFISRLWYVGLASVLCSIYIALCNIKYTTVLTPELSISFRDFKWVYIKTLISSGIWNSFTKLGNLLGHGLDLLLANIFIDAFAMGSLSVTKKIPVVIVSLVATICAAFAPSLTKKYAIGDKVALKKELYFSIKIAGSIALFPCCFMFVFGDCFYSLWVPSMDARLLYLLTIFGTFALPIGMALEGVQNIFTIANKVKIYSIVTFSINILSFLSLLIGMPLIKPEYQIYFLAITTSTWGLVRVGIFLPIYGAHCIDEQKTIFFMPIFRMIIALFFAIVGSLVFKHCFTINSWIDLSLSIIIVFVISLICALLFIFDRQDLTGLIKHKR